MTTQGLLFSSILLLTLLPASSLAEDASKEGNKESLQHFTPTLTDEFKELLRHADTEAGAAFFDKKCSTCHDIEEDGIHQKGPLLWNVFGRKAGSAEGFEYSEAMKNSGHSWDFATLNYYLTKTEQAVPGRIMNFTGIPQAEVRANLLAHMVKFNSKPPELP